MIEALFNIIIAMALYTLSRLFFYLTNLDLYPDIPTGHFFEILYGGMRFDLTAVLYLSSIYLVLAVAPLPQKIRLNPIYAKIQKCFYIIPNMIGLLINSADMVYYHFTDRRTTCSFFTEFQNEGNLFSIFFQSMFQYWYVTLFAIAICIILVLAYRKYGQFTRFSLKPALYYPFASLLFLAGGYFTVIGMRGGFGAYMTPITICDAMLYVDKPAENALVLNTPFCLMRSIDNSSYKNPNYYTEEQLEDIMTPVHSNVSNPVTNSHPNIVFIILESFAAEHTGFYNEPSKVYTPFTDSLLNHSIVYTHAYANGRKSVEGIPAILSSIPSLYEAFWTSSYSTNAISSIADILNSEGYHTSFYHGAPNGSMGISAYANNAHISEYHGMEDYMKDPESERDAFDGTWAIWDEPFMKYYARSLDEMKEPFCTALFTASSHHPFAVPEEYQGVFPEGASPLCKCIAYTDHSLRGFFNEVASQSWFYNTIFVISADHSSQPCLPEYFVDKGLFEIPIAFYIPALADKVDNELARDLKKCLTQYPYADTTTVMAQVDIFPSLMALVGCKKPFFAFGQDVLTKTKENNYAITYLDPYFQIISTHGVIQFDGKKVANVIGDIPQAEQDEMVRYLKAYIQQYVERLMDNRMRE